MCYGRFCLFGAEISIFRHHASGRSSPLVMGHFCRYAKTEECTIPPVSNRLTAPKPIGVGAMPLTLFSVTMPGELRMLSAARSFLEGACEAYRLDRATTHALIIVTGEALTNIVRHAHQNRPGTQIEIHLTIHADRVELTFRDEGEPFDLDAVPVLPPSEERIGGRGVYLMRTLMDEVTCEPRGDGSCGNVLRMVKRFERALRACG